jgi:hypothetical protein
MATSTSSSGCRPPPTPSCARSRVLDAVAIWRSGPRSPVDLVREEIVHRIWRESSAPGRADPAGDAALRTFAAELPRGAVIADLRRPAVGDGFAWGRFGPRTTIRRAGEERIWAVIPPERKPGVLQRIFQRP